MEKKYLVILIDALIKEAISKSEFTDNLRGPRGIKGKDGQDFDLDIHGQELKQFILQNIPRFELTEDQKKELKGEKGDSGEIGDPGKPGKDGKDFSFEDSKQEIESILVSHISNIRDTLKLRFSDLTDEEKESLRGSRGADGKAFILSEHIEEISSLLLSHVNEVKDQLKLKFEDLTEDEVSLLRGPRGQRGKQGKDFVFDEHKDRIIDLLADYITKIQGELKLKFSDLSEEDKNLLKLKFEDLSDDDKKAIRGARGQRGKQGIQGEKGDKGDSGKRGSVWSESKKDPEVFEWNSNGDIHLNTESQDLFIFSSNGAWKKIANIRGARGVPGTPGVQGERGFSGRDGRNGRDAPTIVDIETIQNDSRVKLKFVFSDGSEVVSDSFEIPESKIIKNVFMAGLSLGGGSGGTGADGKSAYEVAVENGFVGTEQDWLDSLVGPPGPGSEIAIADEGNPITSALKGINFVGDLIEAVSSTVIADWVTLSDVDFIGTYEVANPGFVTVTSNLDYRNTPGLLPALHPIYGWRILENWISGTAAGNNGWQVTANSGSVGMNATTGNERISGIARLDTLASSSSAPTLSLGSSAIVFGSRRLVFESRVLLPAVVGEGFVFRAGFHNSLTSAAPTNGAFFEYDSTQANWVIKTVRNGVMTTTITSQPVVTNVWIWLKLEVSLDNSEVNFYYAPDPAADGVMPSYVGIGDINTNIPSGVAQVVAAVYQMIKNAGTSSRSAFLDLCLIESLSF